MAEGSNFNFRKFLSRAFDEDFEVVVGIRLKTTPNCFSFINRTYIKSQNFDSDILYPSLQLLDLDLLYIFHILQCTQ